MQHVHDIYIYKCIDTYICVHVYRFLVCRFVYIPTRYVHCAYIYIYISMVTY